MRAICRMPCRVRRYTRPERRPHGNYCLATDCTSNTSNGICGWREYSPRVCVSGGCNGFLGQRQQATRYAFIVNATNHIDIRYVSERHLCDTTPNPLAPSHNRCGSAADARQNGQTVWRFAFPFCPTLTRNSVSNQRNASPYSRNACCLYHG